MLPPFIIEQIRKREKEGRTHREQPQLDIPVQIPPSMPPDAPQEEVERGVVILDV
jgi:hypothetical protein